MHLRSKVLYRFTCDGCNSIYLGKTKRHFLVRAYEHLGLSYKTGKRFAYNPDNSNNTTVLNHINQSNQCKGNLDSFEIIGSARNDFFLRIKESLLIKKIKPCLLNPNSQSVPLHLFDWVLRIWVSLFIVIVILLWCLWLCFLITHYLIVNVYFLANGCVIIKLNNAGSVPCKRQNASSLAKPKYRRFPPVMKKTRNALETTSNGLETMTILAHHWVE